MWLYPDLQDAAAAQLLANSDVTTFKQGKEMHDQLLSLPTVLINALLSEK